MTVRRELIDELLQDYERPQDILGEGDLLKELTKRYLLRYIPGGATAADVGVGVGHYSELLASRGSKMHLVDVASGLLVAAQERLVKAGLAGQILSITNTSATDLSFIVDDSCLIAMTADVEQHTSRTVYISWYSK